MKLDIFKADEGCFAIYDKKSSAKLLMLHDYGCWSREKRSCEDLPPENALKTDFASIDANKSLHTDIGTVVMGDLSMAGCYVDWAMAKMIITGRGQNKA